MNSDRRQFLQSAALLLGGALSTSCVSAVLGHDPNLSLTTNQSPLNANEHATMMTLVDLILPATDTPGAIDVGVPGFVEFMLAEGYAESQVNIFADGLILLDTISNERHGKPFALADPSAQTAILSEIEAKELAAPGGAMAALFSPGRDRPFFLLSKELSIVGYYTSEAVIKNQFTYSHAAGYFDPCSELSPGDKPWYGGL